MKTVLAILKKVTFAGFLLYGYNFIATNFGLILPINVITLLLITVLCSPALLALFLFKIIVL